MGERFVVHLPVVAADLDTAARMARMVARSMSYLSMVDPGETTVSYEDEQGVQHRVFCDLPMPTGRRCLLAADHLYELALEPSDVLSHATEIEGHPDNVAAALHGGFVLCSRDGEIVTATRLDPPEGVEGLVVIPEEQVPTEEARRAMPEQVPIEDAVANVSAASQLVLGIQRSDLTLIGAGLRDRLHQPHRARLYPRSMEIVEEAPRMGAVGATISGAGPTVLVWTYWQNTGDVMAALQMRVGEWAEVRRVPFDPMGADVPEL